MKKSTKFILSVLLTINVTTLHANSCRNIELKADGLNRKANNAILISRESNYRAKANFYMSKFISCQNKKLMKELRTMTPSVYKNNRRNANESNNVY